MPSFSFLATLALLAFGVLSPIFFVIRRLLHPEAHSRQKTAILSLACFISGVLLYSYASYLRAESSYESMKASYASIQQESKANPASLSKEHAATIRKAVESSEVGVAQSKHLVRLTIVEAPVAFLIYYSALMLLAWIAGLFRPSSQDDKARAESVSADEPENPSFIARACMILVLAIGVEGLGICLILSSGQRLHGEEMMWALGNLGAPVAACILYYLIKGIPRGADRLFAKSTLTPSFFWCIIPTLSILVRAALFGVSR